MYKLIYTRQAQKDAKKILRSGLKKQVMVLLDIIKNDPYQNPPRYEKLVGELSGTLSRRINIQHRLVYQVFEDKNIVKIIPMWTHYE